MLKKTNLYQVFHLLRTLRKESLPLLQL